MSGNEVSRRDRDLLVAYFDGELSVADAMAFEERLATEPALATAFRDFVAADDLGRRLGASGELRAAAVAAGQRRWPRHIVVILLLIAALVVWACVA